MIQSRLDASIFRNRAACGVLVSDATLHYKHDAPDGRDVLYRIAIERDNVRLKSRRYRSNPISHAVWSQSARTLAEATSYIEQFLRADPNDMATLDLKISVLTDQAIIKRHFGETDAAREICHAALTVAVGLIRRDAAMERSIGELAKLRRQARELMRHLLVDQARRRMAQKHGGGLQVTLEDLAGEARHLDDLLAIDQALERLGQEDLHLVTLVEMRFFGGMTAEETAASIGASVHTVRHDLRYALACLRRDLANS